MRLRKYIIDTTTNSGYKGGQKFRHWTTVTKKITTVTQRQPATKMALSRCEGRGHVKGESLESEQQQMQQKNVAMQQQMQ